MALDWNTEPNTAPHSDADLEALAAGISDMRYGAQQTVSESDTSTASGLEQVAAKLDEGTTESSESSSSSLSSFDFILDKPSSSAGTESAAAQPKAANPAPTAAAPVEPAVPAAEQERNVPAAPVSANMPAHAPGAAPTIPAIPAPEPVEIPHATSVNVSSSEAGAAETKKLSLLERLNQPLDAKNAAKGIKGALSKRTGGGAWPTKDTINLYVRSEKELNPRRIVVTAVVCAAVIVAFLKFGVFDQLARVSAKEVELSSYQTQLMMLQSQLADYDEVRTEYETYNVQTSATDIDVLGALDMVDRVVRPSATVVGEQVEENTLTLVLSGANLETYGNLVTTLSGEIQVENVAVRTADNQNSDSTSDVSVTLTITLRTITQVNMLLGGASGQVSSSDEATSDSSAASDYVGSVVSNVTEFGSEPSTDVED